MLLGSSRHNRGASPFLPLLRISACGGTLCTSLDRKAPRSISRYSCSKGEIISFFSFALPSMQRVGRQSVTLSLLHVYCLGGRLDKERNTDTGCPSLHIRPLCTTCALEKRRNSHPAVSPFLCAIQVLTEHPRPSQRKVSHFTILSS